MNTDLRRYYAQRASEYEKIYDKPERQGDLQHLTKISQQIFTGKEILEIGCGTGYWTERISPVAKTIFATDINDSVLEIAKRKIYPKENVTFEKQDFNHLILHKKYETLFAGFIWSHVKLEELDPFIRKANDCVIPNGLVVFMDNNYVEKSSGPLSSNDEQGNTYQPRKLESGKEFLVVKNFPSKEFLLEKIKAHATNIQFYNLTYYWVLSYRYEKGKSID